MNEQAEQLHFALSALDTAAHAIHQVIDIVPDSTSCPMPVWIRSLNICAGSSARLTSVCRVETAASIAQPPNPTEGQKTEAPQCGASVSACRMSYSSGTSSNATILMILISGLTAGPAVSL